MVVAKGQDDSSENEKILNSNHMEGREYVQHNN